MNYVTTPFSEPSSSSSSQAVKDEAAAWLMGAGFSLLLFLGMAHFENFGTAEPPVEIEDIRMAAFAIEPPPPPPKLEEQVQVAETVLPFAGLEVGATDSPVSIAVVPPDLETLVPATSIPPRAKIEFGLLHAELKPKVNVEVDRRHIYQDTEVDQKPRAMVRTVPPIPREVSGDAPTLRVMLLVLIGQDGKPESVRVAESSGNPKFDAIVARTVQEEWLFSPGIRRGKKVRVMAQQAFRVNFSGASSPFHLN
jgi:TonB family protein